MHLLLLLAVVRLARIYAFVPPPCFTSFFSSSRPPYTAPNLATPAVTSHHSLISDRRLLFGSGGSTCNSNIFPLHCTRKTTSRSLALSDNSTTSSSSSSSSSGNSSVGRRIEATALAETIPLDVTVPVGEYQITRPRWYNKAEAAVIVLLVQRLRLLDVRGVEHMLEATEAFREVDPDDIQERALCLMNIAPGANFRTVIARHPRTLLVSTGQMKRVCKIISDAFPNANMARVVERIPSIFSRNVTRLERNIQGLKEFVPEVDSAIFQAAPTMIFIPPETIKRKVELLRLHMPGVNLYTVLKGMPTVLARSSTTVPRGLSALRERFPRATDKNLVRLVEAAPGLLRMSGLNGTLDVQLDALMDLLPGVNITNVFANAPGVLIRSVNSLPAKVKKLELLFPSANVTRMVSRTPGILYLDIDRNIKPKALWIKEVVGLDQDGLDALVETGPWLLKAGWGPLSRLEFAMKAGISKSGGKPLASKLVGLVRRSRVLFAAAYHPAYGNFLRRQLVEEEVEEGESGADDSVQANGHALDGDKQASRAAGQSRRERIDSDEGVDVDAGSDGLIGDGEERELMEATFIEVGHLEDRLGRARKARLGGVIDRPPDLRRLLRPEPMESTDIEHIEGELKMR